MRPAHISRVVAAFAAHPAVQAVVFVGCIAWLLIGGTEATLASTLTIGGFILTQMILNEQRRRDNALHLKIDELILAKGTARNEVVGIEHKAEAEIERIRAETPTDR